MVAAKHPELLALYGTLRRGEAGFKRLGLAKRLRFVGTCKLAGRLFDLGDYPALVAGEGVVTAELYEVRGAGTLALLDEFEGYDPVRPWRSPFVRREVALVEPATEAYVYFYAARRAGERPNRSRPIASGDWKHRFVACG